MRQGCTTRESKPSWITQIGSVDLFRRRSSQVVVLPRPAQEVMSKNLMDFSMPAEKCCFSCWFQEISCNFPAAWTVTILDLDCGCCTSISACSFTYSWWNYDEVHAWIAVLTLVSEVSPQGACFTSKSIKHPVTIVFFTRHGATTSGTWWFVLLIWFAITHLSQHVPKIWPLRETGSVGLQGQ